MEIAKKELEKILDHQRKLFQKDSNRYIKIISEDFDSKLKILADGIVTNTEKITRIDEKVDNIDKQLGKIEIKTYSINKRFGPVERKMDATLEMVAKNTENIYDIQQMVGKNTEDLAIIKSDISFIKHELKQKVDLNEFQALEKRVLFLEKKISRT